MTDLLSGNICTQCFSQRAEASLYPEIRKIHNPFAAYLNRPIQTGATD